MPAVSKAQQQATAIAEHDPEKLNPENRGLLSMSKAQLHDFASTPVKKLPERVSAGRYRSRVGR
jgi:hypothetical protein